MKLLRTTVGSEANREEEISFLGIKLDENLTKSLLNNTQVVRIRKLY